MDSSKGLTLRVMPDTFGICRLASHEAVPAWAAAGAFLSFTRTADELSVVCPDALVPDGVQCQRGWRCLQVMGTFELSAVGVLASLALPLAKAKVSIFAVSTFDTDYLLLQEIDLEVALETLRRQGHIVL